jgi:hypothetical protein
MPTQNLNASALEQEAIRYDRVAGRLRGVGRSPITGVQGRGKLAFLDSTHPVWDACHEAWERNERRLRGGEDVLVELRRFDWESDVPANGEDRTHYEMRRERATYLNFADMYATTVVGHLMRRAPRPGQGLNFGQLGDVRRDRPDVPTRAELVYFNTDGVGNDGSQWDNFWAGALKRAMATGHRWIMVESPRERPGNFAGELAGLRPYLVEIRPGRVTNWEYGTTGQLSWAIVRVLYSAPRLNANGQLVRQPGYGYLVMVRNGVTDLGAQYGEGGWWLYDAKKNLVDEGRWLNTRGEIPMFPLYYERENDPPDERPALSRGALTELGALGVAYMDMESARAFDAWDAAMSLTFLRGVDADGFNLATDKIAEGSRWIPLPITASVSGHVVPDVSDGSSGAVAAEVFDGLTEALFRDAQRMGIAEATSTPDSSGLSKEAGFNEEKSPRLALLASNLEQAQNTAIHFLEQRWGFTTQRGSAQWTRKFDLLGLLDEVRSIFELERLSGLRSKTLGAKLMVAAAEERGFVQDDAERETIRGEYEESAQALADQQAALGALAAESGTELGDGGEE